MSNDEIALAVHAARLELNSASEKVSSASRTLERLIQRLMEKEGQIEMLRNENRRLQAELDQRKNPQTEDKTIRD